MENDLAQSLNDMFGLEVSKFDMGEAEKNIARHINDLIVQDFEKLVRILYTVDVDENKLRRILKQEHGDAGMLIARLIIERQIQKINFRKNHQKNEESEW